MSKNKTENPLRVKRRKLSDYRLDSENANESNERGRYLIETSIDRHGAGRSGVATEDDMLFIGNQTAQKLIDAGIEDVVEITTNGKVWVVVKREGYYEGDIKTKEFAIADNRAAIGSITFDVGQLLKAKQEGVELQHYWHEGELDRLLSSQPAENTKTKGDSKTGGNPEAKEEAMFVDSELPCFESDNQWDIPMLKADLQLTEIFAPLVPFGNITRSHAFTGTYHGYTDDYKFFVELTAPKRIIESGCKGIIEFNVSTYDLMPRCEVLMGIYCKRFMARWCQDYGLPVAVDLNVEAKFFDIALMGVPKGWRSYANRAYNRDLGHLDKAFELACNHAGTKDIFYVVYGSGKQAKLYCQERGWFWFPEFAQKVNGAKY